MSKKSGKEYEQEIAELHRMFGDSYEVLTNHILKDSDGIPREFDVVVKAQINRMEMLGLVECKDLKRRVDIQVVDAFAKKSESVNANFKVIFSRKGFTKNAVKKAASYGIKTHSLVGDNDKGFSIQAGWYLYSKKYRYRFKKGSYDTVRLVNHLSKVNYQDMTYRKRSVFELCIKALCNEYPRCDMPVGNYTVSVEVPEGVRRYVSIKGRRVQLEKLSITFEVAADLKNKLLRIDTKGFYDWHSEKVTAAQGENIHTESFTVGNTEGWDKCKVIPDDDAFKLIMTEGMYPQGSYKEELGMLGSVEVVKND